MKIQEFVQDLSSRYGILMTFAKMKFSDDRCIQTELMMGKEGVERLKLKIAGMKLDEPLPIDLKNTQLTIYQGCCQDQILNAKVGASGKHAFLGALSAEKAALRKDDPEGSTGEEDTG